MSLLSSISPASGGCCGVEQLYYIPYRNLAASYRVGSGTNIYNAAPNPLAESAARKSAAATIISSPPAFRPLTTIAVAIRDVEQHPIVTRLGRPDCPTGLLARICGAIIPSQLCRSMDHVGAHEQAYRTQRTAQLVFQSMRQVQLIATTC
jgi:hypothetical protein